MLDMPRPLRLALRYSVFFGHSVAYLIWFIITIVYGLILAFYYRADPNYSFVVGRLCAQLIFSSLSFLFLPSFARGALFISGVRMVIQNESNMTKHGPCIYVANHQSVFDMPVCCRVSPPRTFVLAKKSFLYIPILGLMWWLTDQVLSFDALLCLNVDFH